jgi:hypothetical protein
MMDETVTGLLLYLPYLYLLVDVTRKSDRRLATFIIFFPAFFGFAGIQLAVHIYGRAMPFREGHMSPLYEALERRGLLGDAFAGLLTHLVVILSSEPKVASAAKAFYSVYMLSLWYHGPHTLLEIAGLDSNADKWLKVSVVTENQYIVLFLAIINGYGAYLLMAQQINNGGSDQNKRHNKKSN